MFTSTLTTDVTAFYDAIAAYYPLFFKDWQTQLEREGLGLRALFRKQREAQGHVVRRVLDVACGAGTQSVPLAQLGYEVVAVDASAGMLAQARQTAADYGVDEHIAFHQADFRHLPGVIDGPFDALVCKGNALAHLTEDDDIELALSHFYDLLRPGGMLVLGLRDFEPFMEHRPRFLPGLVHQDDDAQDAQEIITFDVWEWDDGPPLIATQHRYIIEGDGEQHHTLKRSVRFRPLSAVEINVVLLERGFTDIQQQPDRAEILITARKPA